ncbi:histidine phosphatase family protein [Neisseriaceae bacterium TC5R-5]|nr:histidine phosphatase family protein [Neisseriaceae bacterium TC5R-5]
MNPYTLTLFHHGDIDHGGHLVGNTDRPLSPVGLRQMQDSWKRINHLAPVTALASSPQQQCREFAVQQALSSSLTLKVDEQFMEFDFGDWEGMDLAVMALHYPHWRRRLVEGSLQPPGGESHEIFRTRVLAGLSNWMSVAKGSHRVLITHRGVIIALLAELLDTRLAVAKLMAVHYGGFVQLSILEGHPAYLMRLEAWHA